MIKKFSTLFMGICALTLMSFVLSGCAACCGCQEEATPPKYASEEEAMQEVKENFKPIKAAAKGGWKTFPVKEAQAVANVFKDMATIEDVKKRDATYKKYLANMQKATASLAMAVESKNKDKIAAALKGINCKECHKKYKKD